MSKHPCKAVPCQAEVSWGAGSQVPAPCGFKRSHMPRGALSIKCLVGPVQGTWQHAFVLTFGSNVSMCES